MVGRKASLRACCQDNPVAALERSDIEVEIERVGDEIRIRPVRRPLAGVLEKFAKFGPDFMADGRGEQEHAKREGR